MILKESDDVFIQRSAAYILSQAKFDTCGTVIREKATPVLVDLMSSQSYLIAIPECQALTILDELLQRRLGSSRYLERACFALSYLSYGRHVGIKQETCKRLIRLTTHSKNSVAGPALGVLGNIARWGTFDQIQILAKDSEFLQCLGTSLLGCKPKKFQLEACQIISKIASQSRTFTQDMHSAGLIESLNRLLEVDDSDVKMEAGCTILVANMHVNQ